MSELHPTAASGFAAAARHYDRSRPDYPADAVEALRRELGIEPDRIVVDVGAGTGKLTRWLVASGAHVVAAEPVAEMREVLRTTVPRAAVIDARAEHLPFPDASVDAITVAQAFHWFDAEAALDEVHRALRPGGGFAVVFNRRDLGTAPQAEMDRLLAPHRGDTPTWASDTWSRTLEQADGFAAPQRSEFPHEQHVDAEGLRGRVRSVSFVATLPPEERRRLLEGVDELFARLQQGGSLRLAYRTELWILRSRA